MKKCQFIRKTPTDVVICTKHSCVLGHFFSFFFFHFPVSFSSKKCISLFIRDRGMFSVASLFMTIQVKTECMSKT